MFQVQALGNVGRDPELTYTPGGTAVTKFSLAVSRKGKDGKETNWLSCTVFGKQGEAVQQHVTKGTSLFIQGEFNPRSYTTREGKPGLSLDVVVDKWAFTGGKPSASENKPGQGDESDSFNLDDEFP